MSILQKQGVFLEVVVLVGVNKLEVLTMIEDDCMVLVFIPKNQVPRRFDTELMSPVSSLGYKLAIAIDK